MIIGSLSLALNGLTLIFIYFNICKKPHNKNYQKLKNRMNHRHLRCIKESIVDLNSKYFIEHKDQSEYDAKSRKVPKLRKAEMNVLANDFDDFVEKSHHIKGDRYYYTKVFIKLLKKDKKL